MLVPNREDIQITKETLQNMTDELMQPIDKALSQKINENTSPCEKAARNFLNSIQQAYRELTQANLIYKHIYQMKKIVENPNSSSGSQIMANQELNKSKAIFNNMYLKTQVVDINIKLEEFMVALNEVLNQTLKIAYVYTGKNGKTDIYIINDISTLLKKDIGSKGTGIKARLSVSKKKLNKAISEGNSAIEKLATENYLTEQQIINLTEAHKEVISRYEHHKYKVQSSNSSNKGKTIHLIMWIPYGEWKYDIVTNKGDLQEAYVRAVVNRTGFLGELEQNIDDFMQDVAQVNAKPGLLQGDVEETLSNGRKIEYAVKAGSASYMSISLAIDVAVAILTSNDLFDINSLQQMKKKLGEDITPRNKIMTQDEIIERFKNMNISTELSALISR